VACIRVNVIAIRCSGDPEGECICSNFIGARKSPAPTYYATSILTSGFSSENLALKRKGVEVG
jgi:hypothetical protein